MNFLFGGSGGGLGGLESLYYLDLFLILLVGVLLVVALLMEKSLVIGKQTIFLGNENTKAQFAAWQRPLDYTAVGIFLVTLVAFLLLALYFFWAARAMGSISFFWTLLVFALVTVGFGVFTHSPQFPAGQKPVFKYIFYVLLFLLYGNLFLVARLALTAGMMLFGTWWVITIFVLLPVLLFFAFFRAVVKVSYDLASKNPLAGGLVFLIGLYFAIHSFLFSYWNLNLLESLDPSSLRNPLSLFTLFLKGNGANIPSFLALGFTAIYSCLSFWKLKEAKAKA